MKRVELLTNDTYKVLSYLYDEKDNNNLVRITQKEISERLNINRTKINSIFQSLIDNDLLIHDKSRVGCYFVSKDGLQTVKLFRKTEN